MSAKQKHARAQCQAVLLTSIMRPTAASLPADPCFFYLKCQNVNVKLRWGHQAGHASLPSVPLHAPSHQEAPASEAGEGLELQSTESNVNSTGTCCDPKSLHLCCTLLHNNRVLLHASQALDRHPRHLLQCSRASMQPARSIGSAYAGAVAGPQVL
jgi:hypothetical protein